MPDFKLWDGELARRYLGVRDYPDVARHSIGEMYRQVGDLMVDPETGLARRGLLVRHLVMPDALEQSRQIFHWLAEAVSADTYLNVMDQYYPAGSVLETDRYPELRRKLRRDEYQQAVAIAREAGLWRLDERRPHALLRQRLLAV
jgi:putative pyruvate formate lyase activating enzyme